MFRPNIPSKLKEQILIIDDEAAIWDMACMALENEYFKVFNASKTLNLEAPIPPQKRVY